MASRKKPGNYQIPFHKGNLCHYPGFPTEPDEWRENYTFTAELTFQGYRRGRSAAYLEFTWSSKISPPAPSTRCF